MKRRATKKPFQTKFIFVTGGVVSSIGKGLTAASLGALLEARGFKIAIMKCDPYLNVDPGTMSPFQHGEVYVTDDGAETDLDLGHYERFTHFQVTRKHSISSGQIYDSVISRERRGDYLGGTVQVIPHVTDEIKERFHTVAQGAEITIVEIGGTVGDIEGLPYFEAIRQMRIDLGVGNSLLLHVTYLPYIAVAGETKSKPTQHSVKELRAIGLQPDFLVCRSEKPMDPSQKKKIALFCSVHAEHVISAPDAQTIYEVPLVLHQEHLDELVVKSLNLKSSPPQLKGWNNIVSVLKNPSRSVKIAVVGKYVDLKESYKSLHEALVHGGIANDAKIEVMYVDSEKYTEKTIGNVLKGAHGVLVPGGFGPRGVAGKMAAIRYAREKKVPFFGICYGMQLAAIEFARNVCGIKNATSREWEDSTARNGQFVIDLMTDQRGVIDKGGTMRLGAFDCVLAKRSQSYRAYQKAVISERHRHRFEFNNQFRALLGKAGMECVGINPGRDLVEVIELANHPWFVGVQFHPEFQSRPLDPHPLFEHFIRASLGARRPRGKK